MFNFFDRVVGERRSARRHNLRIAVRYRLWDSEREHASQAENVSEVGIFFEAEEQMRVGSVVHLLLDMPQLASARRSAPWLCTGHVVRLDERSAIPEMKQRVGVAFDCFEVLNGREFAHTSTSSAERDPKLKTSPVNGYGPLEVRGSIRLD